MGWVKLTRSARYDLEEIWCFIAIDNFNAEAADALIDEFAERFELLSIQPQLGLPVDRLRPSTRRSVLHKRYLIFYEPQAGGILILRVLHGSRLLKPHDLDRR